MANTKTILVVATVIIAIIYGCDVKDPIYNTNHPEQAKIKVIIGWKDIGEGIPKPTSYIVEADGHHYETSSDTYTLPDLFDPGNYSVWLYNKVEEIEVKDGIATVKSLPAKERSSGNYIQPMPDWLFTGKVQTSILADTDHSFDISMQQQIRQLTLIVKPEGSATDKIEHITASLSGIAASWDINTNAPVSNESSVTMNFTRITEGENAGSWATTVHLIGVTGTSQKLNGTIHYAGNNPQDTPLESDLTEKLAAFNTDKKTPLTLGGQVEVPSEAGFTATIRNWKEIYSSGTAD